MTNFLPNGYTAPEVQSNYMTLEEGANTFRVLSPAIVGYEWWEETTEGRRPVRVRTLEEIPDEVREATDSRQRAKHFWAMTVYNYAAQSIQILEIKQKTVMRAIEAFVKNPKWGDPQHFDLQIEKVRTGSQERDVEYNVIPEPPAPLDEGIVELARQVPVRLEALYDGQDPFAEPKEEAAPSKRQTNGRERTAHRRVRVYS